MKKSPSETRQMPEAWSHDGKYLLVRRMAPPSQNDLAYFDLERDHALRPFIESRFNESLASFSHDSRWVVRPDESGRDEVYVRRFPEGGRTGACPSRVAKSLVVSGWP